MLARTLQLSKPRFETALQISDGSTGIPAARLPAGCRRYLASPRKNKGHASACPLKLQIVFRFRLSAPDGEGMSAHPNRLSAPRVKLRARSAPPDVPRSAPAAVHAAPDFPARPSSFSAGPIASTAPAFSPRP